eukprot:236087_1
MAYYLFQLSCFCCCCCFNFCLEERKENIKNLEKDVATHDNEQIGEVGLGDPNLKKLEDNLNGIGMLKIAVVAPTNTVKNGEGKKNNQNLLAVHLDNSNGLTPYSPSQDRELSPDSSLIDVMATPKLKHNDSLNNDNQTNNIKVVVYDINVLLSIAYLSEDA